MKKYNILIMLVFFIFQNKLQSQCSESIILTTQSEVDAFNSNYGCTVVNGYVYINGDDIQNLAGLQSITEIEGVLEINSTNISNLEGLENLIFIEHFILRYNNSLVNFEGLDNIMEIESIEVNSNEELTSFKGLENLSSFNGTFTVYDSQFVNFIDLNNLESVGAFIIQYNDDLVNFKGLENLIEIYEIDGDMFYNFNVLGNNKLENFEGLENLTKISGNVFINNNVNLENFQGLENLTCIGTDNIPTSITISNNPSLVSLTGLENVNIIGNEVDISIVFNENLEYCCPLVSYAEFTSFLGNAPSCINNDIVLSICSEFKIQAQAFHDENENGVYDNDEQYLVHNLTVSPNLIFSFINQLGVNYFYLEDIGTYTISYDESNPLWTIDPIYNNIEIEVLESANTDSTIYLPLTPVANISRQNIDLTSSITRCNQETNYWLTYSNLGTVTTSGLIELVPDDLAAFVSSDPLPDSTANGNLYWFYNDLHPTHSEKIHVVFKMPGVDDLGEIIDFKANIRTNEGFAGHRAVLASELICAYDPNDKLHTPSGYGNENYTLFGDTLEYTVRFQNTGNDTAFNVEIRDELSEFLNLSTFEVISYSHDLVHQVDLESRVATFRFNDIYLPDSFVNEPASHGFVKYRILGNEGLNENSDVKNTASIYFDANPAIVTNTVNNRMVSVLPSLPIVSANPSVLDFGEMFLNFLSTEPEVLTITNLGDLSLEINAIEINNPAFSVGTVQNLSVEGSKSKDVMVYFQATEVGDYQGEMTLKSNAGDLVIQLTAKVVVETGLTALSQSKVKIYPNPSAGLFTMESKDANIKLVNIQNSLGEIIFSNKMNQKAYEIDLRSRSKGLYFVTVETAVGVFVEKVVVY